MCLTIIALVTLFILSKLISRKTAVLSISSLIFSMIATFVIVVFAFILSLGCMAQG
jgi:hypothetical protein